MVLPAVWTSTFFFLAIFLHVVRVFFTSLCAYQSSSTNLPVVSIFLTFEAFQGRGDTFFKTHKIIGDIHLLGIIELIRCPAVSVAQDLFFAFFNGDSSDICQSLFSLLFKVDCVVLITLLEVLRLSCEYSRHLVLRKFFFLSKFFASFRLSISTNKLALPGKNISESWHGKLENGICTTHHPSKKMPFINSYGTLTYKRIT